MGEIFLFIFDLKPIFNHEVVAITTFSKLGGENLLMKAVLTAIR